MNSPQGSVLELVVLTAEGTASHPLPLRGKLALGRGEQSDVRLADPAVSRRHAILHVDQELYIEDVGSANGLRVTTPEGSEGTMRLVETHVPPGGSMQLTVGAGLQLGNTRMFTRLVGQAEEKNPASSRVVRSFSALIVRDEAMQKLYGMVALVAQSSLNVLLLGETGVGKEVMAEAIHQQSPRARGPLVCLNCAALSESLLESELFGHEAGAFTGATRPKPGLFELAEGGTVLLDEVGELPLTIQVKLLRVLEERKVLRVGGLTKRPIDVRFVAATNRDLEEEVERGTFRRDLFFRLNGISLTLPPLRERTGEIEALARSFITRVAVQAKLRTEPALSEEALEAITRHPWPGNIRELRNVIERAVVLSAGGTILPVHLGLGKRSSSFPLPKVAHQDSMTLSLPAVPASSVDRRIAPPPIAPLRTRAGESERQRIVEALDRCRGNQTQAAEMLGISRGTLLARLDRYGIQRPRKKE